MRLGEINRRTQYSSWAPMHTCTHIHRQTVCMIAEEQQEEQEVEEFGVGWAARGLQSPWQRSHRAQKKSFSQKEISLRSVQ